MNIGERDLKILLAVAASYVAYFAALLTITGMWGAIGNEQVLFYTYDSKEYRLIADYFISFGSSEVPGVELFDLRPFLFPLILSVYKLIGVAGFQILQILMNAVSVALLFGFLRRVASTLLAVVAAICLAATPTFNFIALHALTETVTYFLIMLLVVACYFMLAEQGKPAWRIVSLFLASLLLCIKTVFLPFFLLLVSVVLFSIRGSRARLLMIAAISPAIAQLALSAAFTGSPTFGGAGGYNLDDRFFPAVYGFVELDRFVHRREPLAREAREKHPTTGSKLVFMAEHPVATLRAHYHVLVNMNMRERSYYVDLRNLNEGKRARQALTRYSEELNQTYFYLHILMFPLLLAQFLLAWRALEAQHAVLMYVLALSLIVPAGLVYWQGDRIIAIAQPAWLTTYAVILSLISRRSRYWMNKIAVARNTN